MRVFGAEGTLVSSRFLPLLGIHRRILHQAASPLFPFHWMLALTPLLLDWLALWDLVR